jgi:hypothetical protein
MLKRFDARLRWLTALCTCASVFLLGVERAYADEASGKWSGELEAHGNYYWENSTEVWVPTGRVSLEAPNGVRMNVSYLADVIASASVAQTGSDSDAVHIEVRQGVGTGVGKAFALGENELDLSVSAIHSWESDYISWLGGVRAGYLFNQKNTGLSLAITGVHDTIYMNQGPTARNFVGNLDGVTFNFGFSQILSPTLTFAAGYQLVYLTGYLGNPYRVPKTGPGRLPNPESPPETRLRHNLEALASWYVPMSRTTVQGFLRYYTDSWELHALTPELRVYQQIGRDITMRLRGRYYWQNSVFFAAQRGMRGLYPADYSGPLTDDPKLTAFDSVQLGVRLSYAFTRFENTFLRFISRGVIDLSFDYQWTAVDSTSFGRRNFFVILGGRLPF